MAVRREELLEVGTSAEVVAFPTAAVRARIARREAVARARRRLAIGALLVLLVLGLLAAGGVGRSAPPTRAGSPGAVTVREGQTLWGLAQRHAPEGVDLRAYVDEVVRINHLQGAPQQGMRLRLP
jgi:nucleoid-associated protein YgaU